MDIFVVRRSSVENVSEDLLKQFQKKSFSDENALKTHCLSYLMLDRILKEVYKVENRKIIFRDKKPVLEDCDINFSISHSKDYLVIGFSYNNCGIDIEKRDSKRDWKAISKRMNFNSQSQEEFYKDWTAFEANYKLNGAYKSIYQAQIDDYYITAVSENPDEQFELYYQNIT